MTKTWWHALMIRDNTSTHTGQCNAFVCNLMMWWHDDAMTTLWYGWWQDDVCHDFVCDGCLDLTNNRDVAPARLLINISLFLGTPIIVIIIVKKTDVSFVPGTFLWLSHPKRRFGGRSWVEKLTTHFCQFIAPITMELRSKPPVESETLHGRLEKGADKTR